MKNATHSPVIADVEVVKPKVEKSMSFCEALSHAFDHNQQIRSKDWAKDVFVQVVDGKLLIKMHGLEGYKF